MCEINYGQKRYEKELCDGLPPCNNNAELIAEMEKNRQASEQANKDMIKTMLKQMTDQAKDSDRQMKELMAEMNKNTLAAIAAMPKPSSGGSSSWLGSAIGAVGSVLGG